MNYTIMTSKQRLEASPIMCGDCGSQCTERGEIYARRLGWEGFTRLRVKYPDGSHQVERIGKCPSCRSS